VSFSPRVGLSGFSVVSTVSIEKLSCDDLKNDVHQLGVVLHPPETLNEKFLIRLRDCVVTLASDHPLKRWLHWIAAPKKLTPQEQKSNEFLREIIQSQFNLITDLKLRQGIVQELTALPEETLGEVFLKSYLYLMVGNVARSDSLLRETIRKPPGENWRRSGSQASFYHHLALENFEQLLSKFSRHPADRKTFLLFCLYLRTYANDPALLNSLKDIDVSEVESKLDLNFLEALAPELVNFLRVERSSASKQAERLKRFDRYPLEEQAYWAWPFVELDSLIIPSMTEILSKIESKDQLWFIYLMENEKLADLYASQKGKSYLPKRRAFLKQGLQNKGSFMMSLFKLIELGDINSDLVKLTVDRLTGLDVD
jgi:hypothetical protein